MAGQGRWESLLLAALDEAPAVGVRRVLERHVGRDPSRAELSAVRRAAHQLAAAGLAEVVHLRAPRVRTGRGSSYLVLTRLGAVVAEEVLLEAAAPPRPAAGPAGDRWGDTALAGRVVAGAVEQAGRSPRVRVERLERERAAELAAELGPALAELQRLHRLLARRGRQHR